MSHGCVLQKSFHLLLHLLFSWSQSVSTCLILSLCCWLADFYLQPGGLPWCYTEINKCLLNTLCLITVSDFTYSELTFGFFTPQMCSSHSLFILRNSKSCPFSCPGQKVIPDPSFSLTFHIQSVYKSWFFFLSFPMLVTSHCFLWLPSMFKSPSFLVVSKSPVTSLSISTGVPHGLFWTQHPEKESNMSQIMSLLCSREVPSCL